MFKKTVSVVLALMMLVAIFATPASAASYNQAQTQEKIEAFISQLVGGEVKIDEDLFADILKKAGLSPSNEEVASAVSQYAIVAYEDVKDVDAIAQAIADDCMYTIATRRNGKQTVYIAVDLSKHPELFEEEVFRAAVYKICEKQNEFVTESPENLDLMSYTRFAGELYMHLKLYHIIDPLTAVLGSVFSFLKSIKERLTVADMDIDESRFPGFLFEIFGAIIME